MLIDMHAHTTDKALWGLHTTSASIVDLEAKDSEYNVLRTVLLATYFPFKGTGLHNLELLQRVASNDQFLVFGSLDLMNVHKDGVQELRELLAQDLIVGIKLYPGYQDILNGSLVTARLQAVLKLASDYQVPVMFHTGELHHCCPRKDRDAGRGKCGTTCWIDRLQYQAEPEFLSQFAWQFPDVKMIFSHLGNPYFDQLQEAMLTLPNVYTDISGQFLSGTDEETEEYYQLIQQKIEDLLRSEELHDRILFGTDFPIQSYESSIRIVESLNCSGAVKEKIRWQNAARLLKLEV